MTITFSKLRDSEDWGLRGEKETPDAQPPEEGTMVTVLKKSGEQQDVEMGRVVAQGDDWWLATTGASNNNNNNNKVCRACTCDSCVGLIAKFKQLVTYLRDQRDAAVPDGHPKPDASSSNYTERRLAREDAELDAIAKRMDEPNTEASEEVAADNPWGDR